MNPNLDIFNNGKDFILEESLIDKVFGKGYKQKMVEQMSSVFTQISSVSLIHRFIIHQLNMRKVPAEIVEVDGAFDKMNQFSSVCNNIAFKFTIGNKPFQIDMEPAVLNTVLGINKKEELKIINEKPILDKVIRFAINYGAHKVGW